MRITIFTLEDGSGNVACEEDYRNISCRNELSHYICEIERIKKKLLKAWEEYDGNL